MICGRDGDDEQEQGALIDGQGIFLSTELASRRNIRFALGAIFVSIVVFLAVVPFVTRPLAHVPAFIPAYESALLICDLITAVLLFGQFNILRSRALFVLGCGYLYTAVFAFAHALTFPDVFSPTGWLGAGPQTTVWLYMFWHGGFPLFVILYAHFKSKERIAADAGDAVHPSSRGSGVVMAAGVVAVLAIVGGCVLFATLGRDMLPVLIVDNRFSPSLSVLLGCIWLLSLLALVFLWSRRSHTVLDIWLIVVMFAWLADIALSAVLNAGRFDLGWYVGRAYGLVAASFLLIVMLIESGTHYARLAQLSAELKAANASLEQLSLHDALTGLANRRFFDAYLAAQIAIARRHKRMLALIICDIDAFKAFNDHYGHQAGDECIKQVAAALRSCCRRPADMAARYGGEEFAIVLPDTELAGAVQIAETVRQAVARLKIPHAHSSAAPEISISGGVAVLLRTIDFTPAQLIAAADRTLYEAKDRGRNQMVAVQPEAANQPA